MNTADIYFPCTVRLNVNLTTSLTIVIEEEFIVKLNIF